MRWSYINADLKEGSWYSREVFLAVVNDIDKDRITMGDQPREVFTLLRKLDIEQAGHDPGQAVF